MQIDLNAVLVLDHVTWVRLRPSPYKLLLFLYFILKLVMLTTSALRDYEYSVY